MGICERAADCRPYGETLICGLCNAPMGIWGILDPFLPVDHIVRGLHNADPGGQEGNQPPGESGSFVALFLRVTRETSQNIVSF